MAIIPKFFFDAVVSIGVAFDEQIKWIGTGFLVGRKKDNSELYSIYLITNHHIIESKTEIVIRFNQKGNDEFKDYKISLVESNEFCYSKHATADVIAIRISPSVLYNNNSEFNWFALDKHALTLSAMKDTDVVEGSIVYTLGFPMNMINSTKNTPVCRIGCISKISDLFEKQESNEYWIDLQAIPGNSGAPVINRPEHLYIQGTSHNDSANLIGIICGTIDYSEKCDNPDCNIEHEKSSGIAIVHPVDVIKEVVEQEFLRRGDSYQ